MILLVVQQADWSLNPASQCRACSAVFSDLQRAVDGHCTFFCSRQLLRDKEVTFAGYKFPHPLDYHILIKVQTKGKKSPREVMDDALTDLCDEFEDIRAKFQVTRWVLTYSCTLPSDEVPSRRATVYFWGQGRV